MNGSDHVFKFLFNYFILNIEEHNSNEDGRTYVLIFKGIHKHACPITCSQLGEVVVFCLCFSVGLLVRHTFHYVNLIDISWGTWKSKFENTHIHTLRMSGPKYCGYFQLRGPFYSLDWIGNCIIRLANENRTNYHFSF